MLIIFYLKNYFYKGIKCFLFQLFKIRSDIKSEFINPIIIFIRFFFQKIFNLPLLSVYFSSINTQF